MPDLPPWPGTTNLALTWVALALFAPFQAFGGAYDIPRAALDAFGLIHLDGLIGLSGASAANAQMFQLPANMLPGKQKILTIPDGSAAGNAYLVTLPVTGLALCQPALGVANTPELSSVAPFVK